MLLKVADFQLEFPGKPGFANTSPWVGKNERQSSFISPKENEISTTVEVESQNEISFIMTVGVMS